MPLYEYDTDTNRFMDVKHLSGMDLCDLYFEDSPLAENWTPVEFGNYREKRGRRPKPEGDFPSAGGYSRQPLMTDRAWRVFEPLIGDCCEPLPCVYPTGGTYWLVHVLKTIDALDMQRSELSINEVSGRVSRVIKWAFHDELIAGHPIFKLPLGKGNALIIGDEFRKVVEDNGLAGLLFDPLPMVDGA